MISEEPYQGLTCFCNPRESGDLLRDRCTDVAWLSSARAVRCWVKSRNERNPRGQLCFLTRLPEELRRKVGMTSSPHGSYAQGYTHATMAPAMGCHPARGSESCKRRLSGDGRLQLACLNVELLVIAGQHTAVNTVPGPCTHRPSHHESGPNLKHLRGHLLA